MITFKRTDASDPGFKALVALLDKYLAIQDGEDHAFYDQFNKIEALKNVMLCYDDGKAVACGAFKEYDKNSVEIKRMFVSPNCRNMGLGYKTLQQLEQWAAELNYASSILETGTKQTEAIHLYKKAGYTITENYGQYKNVANSICMKKQLSIVK